MFSSAMGLTAVRASGDFRFLRNKTYGYWVALVRFCRKRMGKVGKTAQNAQRANIYAEIVDKYRWRVYNPCIFNKPFGGIGL